MRDELLDVEELACLAEARVVIEDWREDYNRSRPHSSLGMRAPAVFAAERTRASRAGRMTRPRGRRAARAATIAARHSLRSRLRNEGRGNLKRGPLPSGRGATFPPVTFTTLSLVVDRQKRGPVR